jgi:hypothetical protein
MTICCDMTPESRNRGARAEVNLLDNGSVNMFPRQRILTNAISRVDASLSVLVISKLIQVFP